MRFIVYKILQHKRRYFFLLFSLVLIQSLFFLTSGFILEQKSRLFYDLAYDIDNCYELEVLFQENFDQDSSYSSFQFTNGDLKHLRNIKGVRYAAIQTPNLWKNLHKSLLYSTDGIDNIFLTQTGNDFEKIFDKKLLKGRMFSLSNLETPELLITKTLADSLGIYNKNLPQSLTLTGNHKKNNQPKAYRIVGILEDVSYMCEGKEVLPVFGNTESADYLLIKAENNINITDIEDRITGVMRALTKSKPVIRLVSLKVVVYELWHEEKRTYLTFLAIIPLVLFYSFLAIFSLFWMEVSRNKTQYALLRAIGFNRNQVFQILIKEACFISLFSGFLTTLILINLKDLIPMPLPFLTLLSLSIISIAVLVVLASIVPAIKTARIQPARTLSNE